MVPLSVVVAIAVIVSASLATLREPVVRLYTSDAAVAAVALTRGGRRRSRGLIRASGRVVSERS